MLHRIRIVTLLISVTVSAFHLYAQDSLNISMVGSYYNRWNSEYDILVDGNYAYVATGTTGLSVVDVSDPENPVEVSIFETPSRTYALALSGNHLVVSNWQYGVHILDITNPLQPEEIGYLLTPGHAYELAISGNHLYVASDSEYLQIIDIETPSNPSIIGSYVTPDRVRGVAIVGNFAYVTASDSGLRIIDIADPTDPMEITHREISGSAYLVSISGNLAFVTNTAGHLYIFDISNPEQPQEIYDTYIPRISDIFPLGNTLYFTMSNLGEGFFIMDITDPADPEIIGNYNTPGHAKTVSVTETEAYICDSHFGLYVIDVSNPGNPTELGSLRKDGAIKETAVLNNYVYLIDYNQTSAYFRIIDKTNPTNLSEVSCTELDSTGFYYNLAISGSYAFLSIGISDWQNSRSVFLVMDITDPEDPTCVANYSFSGAVNDITISGDYAYLTSNRGTLGIINISDPQNPEIVSNFATPGNPEGVDVSGNYAFVADGLTLQIVNVTYPASPYSWGSYPVPAKDVAVSGNFAFVATSTEEIQVIDVSNPMQPVGVEVIDISSSPWRLEIFENYLYVADGTGGLRMFDISDPENLTESGFYDTPGSSREVAISDNYAYVVDTWRFNVFDISEAVPVSEFFRPVKPNSYTLMPAYPNPFNPATTISFMLPEATHVMLKVYDITGRHVDTVFDGMKEAGNHRIMFDGSHLCSGIYFVNLQAVDFQQTNKVVLLK